MNKLGNLSSNLFYFSVSDNLPDHFLSIRKLLINISGHPILNRDVPTSDHVFERRQFHFLHVHATDCFKTKKVTMITHING